MNGLPPLPLVDLTPDEQAQYNCTKALFIDNSTIELLRCPRLLELKWLHAKDMVASKAGRNFGSCLHRGWAVRYERCGANKVDENTSLAIVSAMEAYMAESPPPADDFRDMNHACVVMHAYNKHYGNEPFKLIHNKDGKPVVEQSFAFPFCRLAIPSCLVQIFYTGKIDLGIYNNEGSWSQDHKTAFMFGEAFDAQMQMDGGQLGYCWALQQATGQMPRGYIIDAVRIRRPTRKGEYENTAPVDATDFKRMPFFVTVADLEEWKKDTQHLIQGIFAYHAKGYFPRHRWQCTNKFGRCDMFDVCSVGQASRASVLGSGLYEDASFSPLNKPEGAVK